MTTSISISRTGLHDCWNRIGVRGDGSCPELKQHVHCRNCPVYTKAADQLLDSPAPDKYLAEWTRHYARPLAAAEAERRSLFIFRLGSEWLALPVEMLREVAPLRPIHSLPHRQGGTVRGVINVRGELLICLSLTHLLGVESVSAEQPKNRLEQRRLLVVQGDGGSLTFAVDETHGIHSCPARELTAVPASVSLSTSAFTHAVLPWKGRSVGCLDPKLLRAALNRSLA